MTRHPSWCARPSTGCERGEHRSRPVLVDRPGLLLRVGLLGRLGVTLVEIVVAPAGRPAVVADLTPGEANLIGGALRDLAHSATR